VTGFLSQRLCTVELYFKSKMIILLTSLLIKSIALLLVIDFSVLKADKVILIRLLPWYQQ